MPLTLARRRSRENPTSKCGPPFKVRRHTDPAQAHVPALRAGTAAAEGGVGRVGGKQQRHHDVHPPPMPPLPIFPSLLSPLPIAFPVPAVKVLLQLNAAEGAAAAECSVGRVGGQQQRHHGVLCMGRRHLQPQRARRFPGGDGLKDVGGGMGEDWIFEEWNWGGREMGEEWELVGIADLTYFYLFGPIPSLATLTDLTHLAIGSVVGSSFIGTLDGLAWLSSLTNLQILSLQYLAFTGDLSSLHILSHLRSLHQLHVSRLTNATGEIPRELQYLTALTALDLSNLQFVEFPIWVTQLTNLQYLNVYSKYPHRQGRLLNDDLSQLTALTFLSLYGNNLEGYLPNSWTNLVHLQNLNLGVNQFEGTIPATFSALTDLTA
ncbi:unnamed protein product, partial [Closterium sp. NIES-65]